MLKFVGFVLFFLDFIDFIKKIWMFFCVGFVLKRKLMKYKFYWYYNLVV